MFGCAILWFIINHNAYADCCQFSDIHISQGSVATYLRCGGIFKYEFVADLPVSLPVKEFWKSVNIWGSYGQKFSVLFFLRQCITPVHCSAPTTPYSATPTHHRLCSHSTVFCHAHSPLCSSSYDFRPAPLQFQLHLMTPRWAAGRVSDQGPVGVVCDVKHYNFFSK